MFLGVGKVLLIFFAVMVVSLVTRSNQIEFECNKNNSRSTSSNNKYKTYAAHNENVQFSREREKKKHQIISQIAVVQMLGCQMGSHYNNVSTVSEPRNDHAIIVFLFISSLSFFSFTRRWFVFILLPQIEVRYIRNEREFYVYFNAEHATGLHT